MKKIKMLIDQKGSENGTIVKSFNKDQVYILNSDELAEVFIREEWAVDMETPENLEKERLESINIELNKLDDCIKDCLSPELDSIQMQEKINILKGFEISEDIFHEKFKDAEKFKTKSVKEAEKSLKALKKASINKDKK